ncbi:MULTISPECIES: lipoprotein-releasing ABC transporter ATP-binding protein LolD [Idiomarina]|jgi:lipoprotein-releasing system ATP-binding protein|uniref:Lipoprotein-releasing system ATP-binding protein LolD n=2 Tax=Idiomarina baltica TaxID=190892 RepID=A0A348WNX1_9GAMM|nr:MULTISPECIES: lipoprotein-releasing ABC transporter ATP-binding protein LolD [Idiomarina]EAQ32717.1 ABC-type transport system, involved in lipoprotein release, ATPase component [Idiomarina baltica OS145]KXS35553.1 MAG: ABC-type transport system, involved in lipoprotein release, ATPase component [Idiomarina sp. T82-3]MAF76241.1 lipoprotein-releasing system ATP-binding protein LolD [Idiomarinaceae bacterium]HAR56233.1 lipoprotein-releasing ABC transporter ATP-binding protein LolD [Idiomarina b|tara:strand:- start:1118 stop:1807 length:690 start_codon:yes stop_codon:yes gene_type:complete
MTNDLITAHNVNKTFRDGDNQVTVLKHVNLEVKHGEVMAIVGSSGSGKSTLLHILAGLDVPSSGEVYFEDAEITQLTGSQKAQLRNQNIGFVYQFHHLLPEFDALENVAMPLRISGETESIATERAQLLLERVGLSERMHHRPAQLSGGERQRVAIARAFANKPKLVVADEPTGNLDGQTAESVFELILEMNKEFGTAFIIVTHDMALAERIGSVYRLHDGCLTAVDTI